jgi:hypothetical protein
MKKSIIVMVAVLLALVPMMALLPAERASTLDSTLYSIADSTVAAAIPDLNIDTGPIVINANNETARARGEVRFNLASIPYYAVVTSANLSLYCSSYNGTGSRQYNVHPNTGGWTETGVTWNNRPTFAQSPNASTTVSAAASWAEWTVTDIVQGWIDGTIPNWGLVVMDDDELDDSYEVAQFFSRENTGTDFDPKLEIDYYIPAAITTVEMSDVELHLPTWGLVDVTLNTTEPLGLGTYGIVLGWDINVVDVAIVSFAGMASRNESGAAGTWYLEAATGGQLGPGNDIWLATFNVSVVDDAADFCYTLVSAFLPDSFFDTAGSPVSPDDIYSGEVCYNSRLEGDCYPTGGNEVIDGEDTLTVSQQVGALGSLLTGVDADAADVNDDCDAFIDDVMFMLQYELNKITEFSGGLYTGGSGACSW